jgi:hypothetical protein
LGDSGFATGAADPVDACEVDIKVAPSATSDLEALEFP